MNTNQIVKLVRLNEMEATTEECQPDATENKFEIFNSVRDFGYMTPCATNAASIATCLCCEGIKDVVYAGGCVYINDADIDQAYDILDEYIAFRRPDEVD